MPFYLRTPQSQPHQDKSHLWYKDDSMRLQFYPVALHSPFFPVYALAWLKPSGERKGKCRKLIQQGHSWHALPPVQLTDQSLSEAILLQAAPRTHIWKDYTMHLRVLFSVIFGSEKKKLQGRIYDAAESYLFLEQKSSLYT